MTKNIFISLTFVVSLFSAAYAQKLTQTSNSLLWQISGNGLADNSYIVFTTSNLCEENPTLLPKIINIRSEIKIYYTETGINDPKLTAELQKYLIINENELPINKLLSTQIYSKVKEITGSLNISENMLANFTPMVVSNLLGKAITPNCSNPNYTEEVFRGLGEKYDYKIGELFSIDEAFNILNDYGNKFYTNQINYIAENESIVKADIELKAKLYNEENFSGLQDLFKKSQFLNARYENETIEQMRMKKLTKKIDKVIKDGGALITLDIADAMNDNTSVLNELKNQGYSLTPILN